MVAAAAAAAACCAVCRPGVCSTGDLFKGPKVVTDSMVADGLLKEEELGGLATPVYFLNEATHKQVCVSVCGRQQACVY
jgi:hypothetical protein